MEKGTAAATGSVTKPSKSRTQTPAQRLRLTDPVTRATLKSPQMTEPTRQHASQPTLWVTLLALLLVAMTSTVEVRTCVGACGEPAAVERACCSQLATDLDASCCGCCDEPTDEAPSERDDSERDDDGCCVTFDFDLDQAPTPTVGKPRLPAPAVCWLEPLPTPAARIFESSRPFHYDRGPPRIDRRTALRATQVLLI